MWPLFAYRVDAMAPWAVHGLRRIHISTVVPKDTKLCSYRTERGCRRDAAAAKGPQLPARKGLGELGDCRSSLHFSRRMPSRSIGISGILNKHDSCVG